MEPLSGAAFNIVRNVDILLRILPASVSFLSTFDMVRPTSLCQ